MDMVAFLVALVSWPLALLGCAFVVSGALGLVRLPDLYTRLHAASVTDTGGTLLIVLALLLHAIFTFADPMAAIKLLLIAGFTLFTAPTASHALAKTALLSGLVPVGADGRALADSSEAASRMARSRRPIAAPPDVQVGMQADTQTGDDATAGSDA